MSVDRRVSLGWTACAAAVVAVALTTAAVLAAPADGAETTVYFMTNRARLAKPGFTAIDYVTSYFPPLDGSAFGAERADRTELRSVRVRLPVGKGTSNGGAVAGLPGVLGRDDAFPAPDQPAELDEVCDGLSDLVIYVHGFNNTIRDAALTAAVYQREMPAGCRVLAYSWPAIDRVETYLADRETADWTVRDFRGLLLELAKRRGSGERRDQPLRLHILAHSTGAYVSLTALRELAMIRGAATRPADASPIVHHLVLAAADVEANWFEERVLRENGLSQVERLTSYYTTGDEVLNLSKLVRDPNVFGRYRNRYLRLGQTQPAIPVQERARVELVAVIRPQTPDFLSHSYIVGDRRVVRDIVSVIAGLPRERRAVRPATAADKLLTHESSLKLP